MNQRRPWASRCDAGGVIVCAMLAMMGATPVLSRNVGHPARLIELGSWTAFCDNSGGCGVANLSSRRGAFAANPDAASPWTCLWLGAADRPDMELSVQIDEGRGHGQGPGVEPVRREILLEPARGDSEDPVGAHLVARLGDDGRYQIDARSLPALITDLQSADVMLVRESAVGPVLGRVSLDGLRQALAFAQGSRTNARPLPNFAPRPFTRLERGDTKRATALHRQHCNDELGGGPRVEMFRLSPDRQLWTMPCRPSGSNQKVLAMTGAGNGRLSTLVLSSIVDHDGIGPDFSNLLVQPELGTIEDYHKTRGTGDCGIRRRWAWNGGRFVLVSEVFMPVCFGAGHSQWLRVHMSGPHSAAGVRRSAC